MPPVLLRNELGQSVSAPEADVQYWLNQGYAPVSVEQRVAEARAPVADQGLSGTVTAGLTSLLSGATLGASDVLLSSLATGNERERLRQAREQNPTLSTVAGIAGGAIPALASGGALGAAGRVLSATPAGAVSKAGAKIAGLGAESGVLGRAGALATGAALEGGAQTGGAYLAQTALEDKPLSAEGFLGAMGHGALFAGGIGGALGVGERALVRARSLFPRSEVTAKAAQEVERSAATEIGAALDDGVAMQGTVTREIEALKLKLAKERLAAGGVPDPALVDSIAPGRINAALDKAGAARPRAAFGGTPGTVPVSEGQIIEEAAVGGAPEATRQVRRAFAGPEPAPAPAPAAPEATRLGRRAVEPPAPELSLDERLRRVARAGDIDLAPALEPVVPRGETGAGVAAGSLEDQLAAMARQADAGVPLREMRPAPAKAPDGFDPKLAPEGGALFDGDPVIHAGLPAVGDITRGSFRRHAYVVRPSELAERGVRGVDSGADMLADPRTTDFVDSWSKGGKAPAIEVDMTPSGALVVADGNHRLVAAALDADRPVLVRVRPLEYEVPSADPLGDILVRALDRRPPGGGPPAVELRDAAEDIIANADPRAARIIDAARKEAETRAAVVEMLDPAQTAAGRRGRPAPRPAGDTSVGVPGAPRVAAGPQGAIGGPVPGQALGDGTAVGVGAAPRAGMPDLPPAPRPGLARGTGRGDTADRAVFDFGRVVEPSQRGGTVVGRQIESPIVASSIDDRLRQVAGSKPEGQLADLLEPSSVVSARTRALREEMRRAIGGDIPRGSAWLPMQNQEGDIIGAWPAMVDALESSASIEARSAAMNEMIATALGKRVGNMVPMGADLADAARKISAHESALADLADALGDAAPKTAVARAKAFREAQAANAEAHAQAAAHAAQVIENQAIPAARLAGDLPGTGTAVGVPPGPRRVGAASDVGAVPVGQASELGPDAATRVGVPPGTATDAAGAPMSPPGPAAAALPAGASASAGRNLGALADLGAGLEVLKALGIAVPDIEKLPVIGPVLGWYLKARAAVGIWKRAGGAVPASIEGLVAKKSAGTRDRVAAAMGKMLDVGAASARAATPLAGTMGALASRLFPADTGKEPGKKADAVAQYHRRMDELAAAAQPGAIERFVHQRVPVSDPQLLGAITEAVHRKLAFLDAKAPRPPVVPSLLRGDGEWRPSKEQLASWSRYVAAAEDPASVLEDVAAGRGVTMEAAETLRVVYPSLFQAARVALFQRASQMQDVLPYARRVSLSVLFNIPTDPTTTPGHVRFLRQWVMPKSGGQGAPGPAGPAPAAPPPPVLTGPVSIDDRVMSPLDRRAAR